MSKIGSLDRFDFEKQVNALRQELVNDCSVYRSGQLQFLGFQQSPDDPEGFYLRVDFEKDERESQEGQSFAMPVSPYDLLQFARQILKEFAPTTEDLILDELRVLNARIRNEDKSE